MSSATSFLCDLTSGCKGRVLKFGLIPEAEQVRLRQLGLVRGLEAEVLESTPGGPLLLKIGDGRIAVNREVAAQIKVLMK